VAPITRTVTKMNSTPIRSVSELAAGDVMSSPAVACREEAYFEEVAELLADREISGLPVVDSGGGVVGVVSERDLAHALGGPLIRLVLRRPIHSGPFLRGPHAVPIGAKRAADIMTSPAIVADPRTPLHKLARVMLEEQINRIPIVYLGRLVGVVTRGDLLGALAGLSHGNLALDEPPVVIGSGARDGVFRTETGRGQDPRR
jgi:CBS domain-containing protein